LLQKSNRRRYPRADVRIKATLSLGADNSRQFQATLNTRDISVGGIFFESTFFLKLGQNVHVKLALPPHNRWVRARGKVVRIETKGTPASKPSTGFAIRFEEYFEQSDVVLANYFMAQVLTRFVEDYAKKRKMKLSNAQSEALVDVLASWELSKLEAGQKVWTVPS
jgi:hypothetical protein